MESADIRRRVPDDVEKDIVAFFTQHSEGMFEAGQGKFPRKERYTPLDDFAKHLIDRRDTTGVRDRSALKRRYQKWLLDNNTDAHGVLAEVGAAAQDRVKTRLMEYREKALDDTVATVTATGVGDDVAAVAASDPYKVFWMKMMEKTIEDFVTLPSTGDFWVRSFQRQDANFDEFSSSPRSVKEFSKPRNSFVAFSMVLVRTLLQAGTAPSREAVQNARPPLSLDQRAQAYYIVGPTSPCKVSRGSRSGFRA
mmetsp:Transcript_42933/g.134727  ORF Transcript_42933/g.134727 Transcript_42933/m.134727 type:complete len:252 (-) Transcript_42933:78-833(-)